MQILRRDQVGLQVGDRTAVGRPRGARHHATRRRFPGPARRDQHAGAAAFRTDHAQVVVAVVVLDVGDGAAVGRPRCSALVGLGGGDRARLPAVDGREPVVDPAAAVRAEEDLAAVGRDARIAEGGAGSVVEEVAVLEDGAGVAAVGVHRDHVVVLPGVVEAHVENALRVRRPGREDLVALVAGDAPDAPGGDLDRPDVVVAVAVAGEGDRALVGRPGH